MKEPIKIYKYNWDKKYIETSIGIFKFQVCYRKNKHGIKAILVTLRDCYRIESEINGINIGSYLAPGSSYLLRWGISICHNQDYNKFNLKMGIHMAIHRALNGYNLGQEFAGIVGRDRARDIKRDFKDNKYSLSRFQ